VLKVALCSRNTFLKALPGGCKIRRESGGFHLDDDLLSVSRVSRVVTSQLKVYKQKLFPSCAIAMLQGVTWKVLLGVEKSIRVSWDSACGD
jgi:hypothetical protein